MSTEKHTRVTLAPGRTGLGDQTSRTIDFLRELAEPSAPSDQIAAALELARTLGVAPTTLTDRWETLATLGAADLALARAAEPHLDARGILDEAHAAGEIVPDAAASPAATWGVFAAEGSPTPLVATAVGDSWSLTGIKPWCSLAGRLDRALITARTTDGPRLLFAVDLHHPGVTVPGGTWHSRGLTEIPSGPVEFDVVAAHAVGSPGWYLERPGFATGGIGVAACWFGGAVGLARTLFDFCAAAATPSPFALMHLGAVDEALADARRALAEAVSVIEAGTLSSTNGAILAKRVRGTVARTCETVIERTGHALGPAPLALDPEHAKRVVDLQLYIRQHHAERDEAGLGEALLDARVEGNRPW